MTVERTAKESAIVSDYLSALPVVENLGLEGAIFGEERESWRDFVHDAQDFVLPVRSSVNEGAIVCGFIDFEHEVLLEDRAIAVDREYRRPNFIARFIRPGIGDIDYPTSVRNYGYEDETVF